MCDEFESLWRDGQFVDAGDMEVNDRDTLVRLVRGDIIYGRDGDAYASLAEGNDLIERDLSNLGLQLIVNTTWEFAYAAEVADELRGFVALRRNARVDGDVMYMAIRLRRYYEQCLARRESVPRISEDDLFEMWKSSPFSNGTEDDATLATRRFNGLLDRLRKRGLGILRKDNGLSTYQILPSLMVFVSDDVLSQVIITDDESDGE